MIRKSELELIYFTADLHFCHPFVAATRGFGPKCENLNKLRHSMSSDEFDSLCHVDNHDRKVVNRINSMVGKNDELYILGDVSRGTGDSLYEALKVVDRLYVPSCHRHLVLGNHESFHLGPSDAVEVSKRFSTVSLFEYLYLDGIPVVMSHLPLKRFMVKNEYHSRNLAKNAFSKKYRKNSVEVPDNVLHLHGHTHSSTPFDCNCSNSVNVGLDAWGGFPVSWDELLDVI